MSYFPRNSGTFTPILTDNSLSGGEGQTYSAQEGFYIKEGPLVYIRIFLDMSSLGTLTTGEQARIIGLPFRPTGIQILNAGRAFGLNLPASEQVVYAQTNAVGSGRLDLHHWAGTDTASPFLLSELSSNGEITFSGVYATNE